jgi:hypothetical protein
MHAGARCRGVQHEAGRGTCVVGLAGARDQGRIGIAFAGCDNCDATGVEGGAQVDGEGKDDIFLIDLGAENGAGLLVAMGCIEHDGELTRRWLLGLEGGERKQKGGAAKCCERGVARLVRPWLRVAFQRWSFRLVCGLVCGLVSRAASGSAPGSACGRA